MSFPASVLAICILCIFAGAFIGAIGIAMLASKRCEDCAIENEIAKKAEVLKPDQEHWKSGPHFS